MCRYAYPWRPYKTHYVCLPCRHTAKYLPRTNPRCPSCRQPMLDLGHDFKVPCRRDHNQWRKVGILVAAGITFHSCGCSGPGPRPHTLAATPKPN